MSLSLPSLSSSQSIFLHKSLHFPIKPTSHSLSFSRITNKSHQLVSSSTSIQTTFRHTHLRHIISFGNERKQLGFCVKAVEDGEKGESSKNEEVEFRGEGESTMPERFRYLTKEAPDHPVRWPWFIALAFLLYAWRAVLFELSNWRKGVVGIVHLVGYIFKLVLALVFHFIGDPITSVIRFIETAIYTIRAFYSSVVAYAPVPELTMIIILASFILSIAEATVPDSVNSQPYLFTLSGLIGYSAVRGFISEPFFYTLLVGIYGFSRLIKKRDNVSAALPVAAVLVGVGEPWVRFLVIISYLALAIIHHSKKSTREKEVEVSASGSRIPLPLLSVALAIGIRVATKWAGYRHLTWMIV